MPPTAKTSTPTRGVAWVSTTGDDYQPVDYEFTTETLDAVASNSSGFLTVANDQNGMGLGVAFDRRDRLEAGHWDHSPTWLWAEWHLSMHPSSCLEATRRQAPSWVWTSEDRTEWEEAVVATDLPADSQIRSIHQH